MVSIGLMVVTMGSCLLLAIAPYCSHRKHGVLQNTSFLANPNLEMLTKRPACTKLQQHQNHKVALHSPRGLSLA